jgi:flagellar biosynthesis/type III secretory pathway protein FliH
MNLKQLKETAREKFNIQLYRGKEEYFISKQGLDHLIDSIHQAAFSEGYREGFAQGKFDAQMDIEAIKK